MNGLYLMEAHRNLLNRQIGVLSEFIRLGNLTNILQATKQFISTLSDYLTLQEVAISELSGTGKIYFQVKSENQSIRNDLEDIYMIHVTEPDGEFVQTIRKIIAAVEDKLKDDIRLLKSMNPKEKLAEAFGFVA